MRVCVDGAADAAVAIGGGATDRLEGADLAGPPQRLPVACARACGQQEPAAAVRT